MFLAAKLEFAFEPQRRLGGRGRAIAPRDRRADRCDNCSLRDGVRQFRRSPAAARTPLRRGLPRRGERGSVADDERHDLPVE